ncbi:hypothetical protein PMAYCL1PPCAC_04950, partial [Pristionchus mayeri]
FLRTTFSDSEQKYPANCGEVLPTMEVVGNYANLGPVQKYGDYGFCTTGKFQYLARSLDKKSQEPWTDTYITYSTYVGCVDGTW